ncbi:histidine kinase sensor domain-containing protein [Vibrio cortegadensis]|uniref:sensor histidine kinase n=1 Tax=Vibrio cortegadensis TaxID=1328770 RepID=UPI0021C2C555|nr:sensor histidine kinase [Vibrio cortegadensis]MDN3696951.1 histidine kinase sensor domain-containing protein [Vibrio cortegadensis]
MTLSGMALTLKQHRSGLAFKLFGYLAAILISILVVQTLAEKALVKALLKIPAEVKRDMQDLAYQANILINEGDMDELADWANAQPYYLFIIDDNKRPITHRSMHPHFEFKLRYLRTIDVQLDDRVNRPLIGLPLENGNTLVIQLPHQVHPAKNFVYYFTLIKVVIAFVILTLFTGIMLRFLQQPLDRLREASRRLSQGDFSVSVVNELNSKTTEFHELATDFDHMTQKIHSLAEKQRRLIRDVSHELRTPLARQNLALHLLRKKSQDSEQHLITRLETEINEMDDLIGEILQFSRLENSQYDAEYLPLQLESYCEIQASQSKMELIGNQQIQTHLNNQTPMINADARLLLRILKNLIGNAIKYAGQDAVIQVSVSNAFTADKSKLQTGMQNFVVVTVEDDGPGIPKHQLKSIFDPFTRLESARDKQSGGYGLGLAIVKEAMNLMDGKIVAENSEITGGLKISLYFKYSH